MADSKTKKADLPIALLPSRRSYDVVLADLLEGKRALASDVFTPTARQIWRSASANCSPKANL